MWHDKFSDKSARLAAKSHMDLSTVYSKTPKGLRARASLIGGLSSHLMKVLTHVDGSAKAENILDKFDNLSPQQLSADLRKLEQEGYIRLATVTSAVDDGWALTINFEPMVVEEFQSEEALEISAQTKKAEQQVKQAQAEKLTAQLQTLHEEELRLAAQQKADKKAQKLRAKEKTKAETKVKAQLEKERLAQLQQEQAQAAAEEVRKKAEVETNLKAQQQALQLAERQAAEQASKLAEATRLKTEMKAREAAEHVAAAAEATAKENARREIKRISRESEEAQKRADVEIKAEQEAERIEALRAAKAAEEARLAAIKIAEAAEQEKLKIEAEAQAVADNAKQDLEKLTQEKLEKDKLDKEILVQQKLEQDRLDKEKVRQDISKVLRKAEENRKNAVERAKEEKLEAKRQAKAEQEARLHAERKAKDEAKELAKQAKLKVQAEEKVKQEAAESAKHEVARIAKEAEIARDEAEQQAKQVTEASAFTARVEVESIGLEHSQTVQVAHAKLASEEQTNNEAKENARLEMERIGREADLARQKTIVEQHLEETNINSANRNLPILNDFDVAEAAEEATFQAEEQAEAQKTAQHTANETVYKIEKTAKQATEDSGRADIKNAAIAEAEAMVSLQGNVKSYISAKKLKQSFFSIFKVMFIYVPLLVLVLLALASFINLSTLIKPIEQLASNSLGESVVIKKVHASLWPQPHLVLEQVVIGSSKNIKAIHVLPAVSSLFKEVKVAKSLVIDGLDIEQANFDRPLQWVSSLSNAKNLKVEQINLKNLTLAIRDLQLEPFDGKVNLTATGGLGSIDLVSRNNALSVLISPQGSEYEIALKATNWGLPFNQKIVFSTLNAKGIASVNQLKFNQIEGEIYGGTMTGQADIQWPKAKSQWQSAGDFKLENVNAEQLLNNFGSAVLIDGKLALNGSFSSKASEAAKLASASLLSANFDVRQGGIEGIELARAVLTRGEQSLAGDTTNFDKLTGSLKSNKGQCQLGRLVLSSPQLQASGYLNINASQNVSGRINADLVAKSRRLQANFGITGRGKDLKSQ